MRKRINLEQIRLARLGTLGSSRDVSPIAVEKRHVVPRDCRRLRVSQEFEKIRCQFQRPLDWATVRMPGRTRSRLRARFWLRADYRAGLHCRSVVGSLEVSYSDNLQLGENPQLDFTVRITLGQTTETPVRPFGQAKIFDENVGMTDTLTIALGGAGGTLIGNGLSAD
jgi:hypothetical protein